MILAIQPLINDDGVIVMKIEAERSALGSEQDGTVIGFDNGQPIRSPPINKITASTTISCKSGQTVVFAGLMTTNRETLERKVPFLGDVPIFGNLFRYESDVNRKTELLIIMTPYIISDDEDYEMIKMMESQRMSWCLGDVTSLHGDVGLMSNGCVFCDSDIPVIFPDMDPFGVMPHNWGHQHQHEAGDYYQEGSPTLPLEGAPIPVPPTPVDQVDYRGSQFEPARRLPPATPIGPPPQRLDGQSQQTAPPIQRVGFQAARYGTPLNATTTATRQRGL